MAASRPSVDYREVRRPAPRLLRAVVVGAALLTGAALLLARPGALGSAALVMALASFLWWCRVTRYEVRVRSGRLEVCFGPFRARRIPVQRVVGCAEHMAYPWGDGPEGRRQVAGVDIWRAGSGAGLLVELDGGGALWVDCGRPDRLAAALKPRRRRQRRGA